MRTEAPHEYPVVSFFLTIGLAEKLAPLLKPTDIGQLRCVLLRRERFASHQHKLGGVYVVEVVALIDVNHERPVIPFQGFITHSPVQPPHSDWTF